MVHAANILPKEKHIQTTHIDNVSDYIGRIKEYIKERNQENSILVYRGEPDCYPLPCRPNIFRKEVMNSNPFFEKNLFDTMRQNRLSGEKRYLDNAIDAQHGEFPSRLLDVSYNCLTALYFAVTPYYHKNEDDMDDRDGMVFMFFVDEIFSPSAQNTNDNYDAIIRRDKPWYQNKSLFEKNHKFIDHAKLNNRIVAQQGAFILFPGDEPENLPEYMSCGILIPRKAKPQMRQDLKQLFGIHTGSIYPEIINLVEELSSKSQKLNTDDFNCQNELNHAIRQFNKELTYYLYYAIQQKRAGAENLEQVLMYIEHVADSYRRGLLEFIGDIQETPQKEEMPVDSEVLAEVISRYNALIKQFADDVRQYGLGEFSGTPLRIQINK